MSEQQDLFQQIQVVLAGHTESKVMQALLKSLLVVIGVSAPDLPRALALVDALPTELKPLLQAEWLNYRLHRARLSDSPTESGDDTPAVCL
jgi:hypothetical protein